MNALAIMPVQWADFRDIDQVEPIGQSDFPVISEIREVLKRHGAMNRWGLALLHSHFDLQADEVMLETSNAAKRELTLRPVKEDEAGTNNVGTIFALRDGEFETMAWCRRYCYRLIWGHSDSHKTEK